MRLPQALVLWTAAAVFAAGAYRVIGAGGQRAAGLENGSVFNETPQGVSLAFRYLNERSNAGRGRAPLVLSQRLGPGRLPSDAVLFRLARGRWAPRCSSGRRRATGPA